MDKNNGIPERTTDRRRDFRTRRKEWRHFLRLKRANTSVFMMITDLFDL